MWRTPVASPSSTNRRRSSQVGRVVIVASLLAVVAVVVARTWPGHSAIINPQCTARGAAGTFVLTPDQAANATTIAAVGKRLGLPDHAVSVALAASLQESRLHNLSGGDRDSIGLFQQRPSQGWGTPSQIADPVYAATAFYDHLAHVPDWASRSVTDAAQAVQRSAAPSAYGAWESEARTLAAALTGEVSGAFSCRFAPPHGQPLRAEMAAAMSRELGAPTLAATVDGPRGWLVASWIIGHARQYRVTSVTFAGRRWTPRSGAWVPRPPDLARVQV
jgi:hypothetical protein